VWFQKAALQGHALARLMLGSMYAAGRGRPKDPQAALLWISAAAQQGEPRAKALLAPLESQLSAAQLAEARLRARSLADAAQPVSVLALFH
jgi:TPR repeat protein